MRRTALVVSLLVCGCGRSELIEGRETELPSLGTGGAGPPATRTCSASDAGPAALDTVSTWPPGCIDVSYTAEIQREVPLLEAALARWSGEACSRICFNPAREWIPRTGQSQHLLFDYDDGALRPADGNLGVSFVNVPGRGFVRQSVMMMRRRNTVSTAEDFTQAVGRALGFAAVPGVSSSLSESRVELTEADRQSLCSVYPCR